MDQALIRKSDDEPAARLAPLQVFEVCRAEGCKHSERRISRDYRCFVPLISFSSAWAALLK